MAGLEPSEIFTRFFVKYGTGELVDLINEATNGAFDARKGEHCDSPKGVSWDPACVGCACQQIQGRLLVGWCGCAHLEHFWPLAADGGMEI